MALHVSASLLSMTGSSMALSSILNLLARTQRTLRNKPIQDEKGQSEGQEGGQERHGAV